jgi:hypothetical protein
MDEIIELKEEIRGLKAEIKQLFARPDRQSVQAEIDYSLEKEKSLQIKLADWQKQREDIVRNLSEQLSTELKGQNRGHVIEYYQNKLQTYGVQSDPPSGRYGHRIDFIIRSSLVNPMLAVMLGNSSRPGSSTSAAQSCTSVTFVT